jgi:hypothetical protein
MHFLTKVFNTEKVYQFKRKMRNKLELKIKLIECLETMDIKNLNFANITYRANAQMVNHVILLILKVN